MTRGKGRGRRSIDRGFVLRGAALAAAFAAGLSLGLRLHWIPALLFGINAATFALYGLDKRRARRGKVRVPEGTLLLFSFAGGSLGALAGQRLLRHKTRKGSFQVAFWLLVAIQAALASYVIWKLAW